jgi:hypothetical protein
MARRLRFAGHDAAFVSLALAAVVVVAESAVVTVAVVVTAVVAAALLKELLRATLLSTPTTSLLSPASAATRLPGPSPARLSPERAYKAPCLQRLIAFTGQRHVHSLPFSFFPRHDIRRGEMSYSLFSTG